LLAVATALLLLLWSVRVFLRPRRSVVAPDRLWPALACLALVLVVVDLQVLQFLPRDWHHPIWLKASEVLGDHVRGSISVDPYATGTATMRLLTYVGVFWLVLQVARSPTGARRVVQAVALIGLGYAVYGLFAYFSGLDFWLWWHRGAWGRVLTSTFVNRNHYATYAGLGLLCAFGLLIGSGTSERRLGQDRRPLIAALALLSTSRGWCLVAVVCLALALVMTASRAGFASSALGLAALLVSLGTGRRIPGRRIAAGAAFAAVLGGAVLVFGGDDLKYRLDRTDVSTESRFPGYQRIGLAILDRPWLGTGYGTFEQVFQAYQGTFDHARWDNAHNTYLENAFELGIPAAVALLAAIGWIVHATARALRRRRGSALYPCLAIAATVLVGAHALLDFSLEIPAVAVTYAAMLGVGCARAPMRSARARRRRSAGWRRRRGGPGIALTAAAAALLLVLAGPRAAALLTALPVKLAELQMDAGRAPGPEALERAIEAGHRAVGWSDDPGIWSTLGAAELILAAQPRLPPATRQRHLARADSALRRTLARAPANPVAWTRLAQALLVQGGEPATFSQALALSVLTGPNHTTLLPLRSMLAASAWDRLDLHTRALFRAQFAQTLRIAPQRLVRMVRRNERAVNVIRTELDSHPALVAEFDRLVLILGRS